MHSLINLWAMQFLKNVANIGEISVGRWRDTFTLRPWVGPIRLDIWPADIYSSFAYH